MGDVVDFKSKSKEAETPKADVVGMLIDQLNQVAQQENIIGAMVVLMTDKREVISGFFETSFQDEAVMEKVLNYDIFMRQQARQIEMEV